MNQEFDRNEPWLDPSYSTGASEPPKRSNALLVVLVREFAVSGLRMLASDKGRVIAAAWSGKV